MVSPFIKRYLLALDRYKWPGLATLLGVLGISAVVAMQPPPPPQYRAEGVLVQNAPVVALTATGTEVQQRGQGIISEEFLLADVLLQQVSQELERRGMAMDPETLRYRTTVKLEGEENLVQRVTVTFRGTDEEQAQLALSLLFEAMVELSRVTNRARIRAIVTALDERLPAVETDLRAAEQALEAYDRTEGPAIQAALDGSLLGAISGGQQQQRQNQITLAGLDSQIQSLQQQLGLTPGQAFTASALSADPIIAQLRSQILESETQLKLLSATLRESHPTIQDLRQNLAAYNALLAERAQEVIGGQDLAALPSVSEVRQNSSLDPARAALANQLVTLSAQRAALASQQQVLSQSDGQLRQQYSSLPNKQLERNRLAQQVALNQALYDQIQAKRIDAQAAEAETASSLTVAQPPTTTLQADPPTSPVVVMAVGGLLGVVAAGAVVFLLDLLDSTARTPDDLQGILSDQDVPMLGLVPALAATSSQGWPILYQPHTPDLEIYERLRSSLRRAGSLSESGTPPRVVLVVSSRSGEGKTTSAFNLGIAAARAGRRTLIVEADLRQPSCGHRLGVKLNPAAISEPLHYYAGRQQEPIQLAPWVENLYLAPSPGPQPHPAAILESSEMGQFLTDARARFDLVLIDAPPLGNSNDALLLGATSDGLLLVTRPGYTDKAVLEALLEQLLENEDLPLLGAIVNAADRTTAASATLSTTDSAAVTPGPQPLIRSIDF
ncbi:MULTISPECIES: tyrosine-protein kinase domain-containing protein [Cyanophyceae]|uniref:GumC family protein n=1 Tax=Cyanophyceae TaxID=3028117 RepID=UPI00168742FF|nr:MULTISPECIES: tyrosine-protein kinase domain-containing protein [Cyanophyceae]MBD1918152.1 AAA family ATPase [Phormidium sp. FACHB-77]MBD2030184.1 AAA family ATPase [Phormidium sp. FACHB-322]MBD2051444.1 AAA family ATPase [Leptolyngbya sp. FACHB-60]